MCESVAGCLRSERSVGLTRACFRPTQVNFAFKLTPMGRAADPPPAKRPSLEAEPKVEEKGEGDKAGGGALLPLVAPRMPERENLFQIEIFEKGKLKYAVLANMQFDADWEKNVKDFAQGDIFSPDYTDFGMMRMALQDSALHVVALRPMKFEKEEDDNVEIDDNEDDDEDDDEEEEEEDLAKLKDKREAERRKAWLAWRAGADREIGLDRREENRRNACKEGVKTVDDRCFEMRVVAPHVIEYCVGGLPIYRTDSYMEKPNDAAELLPFVALGGQEVRSGQMVWRRTLLIRSAPQHCALFNPGARPFGDT